jgi:hypothetical protein
MALQQIVPPDYTYSFGSGVNPGESVSWDGGKNWAQVLSEMLDSKGLRASIKGRSIQIQEGDSQGNPAPRAEASSSVTVADAMAATMPAAGDSSGAPAERTQAPAQTPEPAAKPVAKVEAVPPVYPPEVFAKTASATTAQVPSLVEPASQRVLGRISESGGLKVEDVKETVQLQGSPEAAKAARLSVTEHALGLAGQPGEPEDTMAASDVSSVKTTSYSVTKTTRKVLEDQPARRVNITDPGETPSRQPEVQALNLKPVKAEAPASTKPAAAPAMEMAAAEIAPVPQKASVPSGSVAKDLSVSDQRKKLEDMARQQGIVLDSKNYNTEALGKIFNNGIAPASGGDGGESAGLKAPAQPAAVTRRIAPAAPVSLVPPVKVKPQAAATPVEGGALKSADVSSPASSPSAAAGETGFWEASRGADLKAVLGEWSRQSGVTLVWKADQPYTVGSNIMVHGGFNDAIKTLFAEGSKSGEFPVMRLNDGGGAQGTLIVEDKS